MIIIGKIVAPHGVRGELRIAPLTDFPDRFLTQKQVLTEDGNLFQVEYCRRHQQNYLTKFRGVDDRDGAEKLKGKLLKVTRADLVPLPEGSYYTFDIIGLEVFDGSGVSLGRVNDVLATGSNDVYIVDQVGGQPLLIPAIKDVVKVIDVPGKKMIVKLQEELV